MRPTKIVSGGQTGVDRAALDAAIAAGIEHGGWCPQGRRAEDGIIPAHYQLTETTGVDYRVRTERNVIDSDATLILTRGPLRGGTSLTKKYAREHGRPCLVVRLDRPVDMASIHQWLAENRVAVLNVAGPRESENPGIQAEASAVVRQLLT